MTQAEYKRAFAQADEDDVIEHITTTFNCREAAVDSIGNVWICNPQSGHWINEHQLSILAYNEGIIIIGSDYDRETTP